MQARFGLMGNDIVQGWLNSSIRNLNSNGPSGNKLDLGKAAWVTVKVTMTMTAMTINTLATLVILTGA